jgi:hypothetical protein
LKPQRADDEWGLLVNALVVLCARDVEIMLDVAFPVAAAFKIIAVASIFEI